MVTYNNNYLVINVVIIKYKNYYLYITTNLLKRPSFENKKLLRKLQGASRISLSVKAGTAKNSFRHSF